MLFRASADRGFSAPDNATPVLLDSLMKRRILTFAIILGWAAVAWGAAEPVTLTTLRAIHSIGNVEAGQSLPVAFEATVTYFRGYENFMFVQDEDSAVFVLVRRSPNLVPGDRVLVRGTTAASFHPVVIAGSVTLLHHGAMPKPITTGFDELIRGQHDSRLVVVHAHVRAADLLVSPLAPVQSSRLQLIAEGNHIEAYLDCNDAGAFEGLLDAEVEVTGIAAGKFDDKMQQTGVVLYISSLANVKILKRASVSPWSLPVTPMDRIIAVPHTNGLTPRVRVHGTITYYQPDSAVVLQDGPKSLWIATHTREPLKIGDQADATGFPEARDRLLTLTDGGIQDSHVFQPVTPQPATWHQLAFWSANEPGGHQDDLVSIEGVIVADVREAIQDEYVLAADGRLFTAIYHHPLTAGALSPMIEIPLGSKVRVTGICAIVESYTINPGKEVPFNILMRSPQDVVVIESAPWWTAAHALWVVALLVLVILGMTGWLAVVRRQARMRVLTVTDPLTGLYNRRGFFLLAEHQWQLALRKKTAFLLFYIDIDEFKEINDTYGHKEGDRALQTVAAVLKECFRKTDLIARIGGDEFVLTTDLSPDSRAMLEQRLVRAIQESASKAGRPYQISLSIGILQCDGALGAHSLEDLLAKADTLMYEQKREHRNRAQR
jgi:diguanylate cyclase (GGDEF)-like protein